MDRAMGEMNEYPERNLMRIDERQNDMAARIILARPGRRNQLLIDWARRYTVRRVQEGREVVSNR